MPTVAATNPLQAVWLSGGRIHATYHLPSNAVPYTITFYPAHGISMGYLLLPGSVLGHATRTAWTSSNLEQQILEQGTYQVRLAYGPNASCVADAENKSYNQIMRCPHSMSPPVSVTVGQVIGPGSLVQRSEGSGEFASASVSANVTSPNTFTVRISTAPTRQNVHINWDITCSKGRAVRGASGSWDDTTPVNDSSSIRVPFASILANPDGCTIAVGASLSDSMPATIRLALYVDKSHV